MANNPPSVPGTILTEADWNWDDEAHDSAVHAIAWEPLSDNPGALLDIDYILQGVAPEPPATTLSFWVSPATLVFDPAWDLITDIDRTGWSFQLSLNAIRRSEPDERGNYDWTLEGDGITISLGAPGFTQYLRRPPVHCPRHILSVEERAVSASTGAATPPTESGSQGIHAGRSIRHPHAKTRRPVRAD